MLTLVFALVSQSPDLKIDPLILGQAAQVWSVVARKDNPVWPGWDASSTPLLIYFPDKQDVLINHPKPPEGFALYKGPLKLPFRTVHVRDGKTFKDMDGQNTADEVNGVITLIVADTLSTRRQGMESIAGFAASATPEQLRQAIDNWLWPSPYDTLGTVAHEAFHVYQEKKAPAKAGDEWSLTRYPSLSPLNNAGVAMEAELLRTALGATSDDEVRRLGTQWLALRQDRRGAMEPAMSAYEDGTEFSEGLAKFIEYRLFEVLQGRKPMPELFWAQGFTGFGRMADERARLLSQMVDMMQGKVSVNNDPYGASPVRMRMYFSGMGVAALLDRLRAPNWHDRILQPGTTLTGLVAERLGAGNLGAIAAEVKATPRYRELLAAAQKLEQDGQKHIAEVVKGIEEAPSRLVIDYSAADQNRIRFGYTPFGVLRIDDNRTVFRLIPISARLGTVVFRQNAVSPVMQDRASKTVSLALREPVTEALLAEKLGADWSTRDVDLKGLDLPGVSLSEGKGRLRLQGGTLVIRIV